MLISGLPTEFLNYEAGVLSTETKAIRYRYVECGFSSRVWDVVEIAIGIRIFLIDCWMEYAVFDAFDAGDSFQ